MSYVLLARTKQWHIPFVICFRAWASADFDGLFNDIRSNVALSITAAARILDFATHQATTRVGAGHEVFEI